VSRSIASEGAPGYLSTSLCFNNNDSCHSNDSDSELVIALIVMTTIVMMAVMMVVMMEVWMMISINSTSVYDKQPTSTYHTQKVKKKLNRACNVRE
jgi:hypothetical protein